MSTSGLFINSNQSAIVAENNLQNTSNALGQSLQRLSSGLRITSASVDPAGYEIAQGLNSTNLGINQATRNANNANSLVAIASGGLSTIQGMLGTMQTLATEAANGTSSTSDLQAINSEYNQLGSEITQLAQSNQFNGLHLLNAGGGSAYVTVASGAGTIEAATSGSFNFQIGYNANTATNQISVSISGTQASQLGMSGGTVILSSGSTVMTATEFISLSGINYYSAGTGGGVSTLGNLSTYTTFNAAGTTNLGATQTSVDLLSTGDALTALSAVQAANVQVAGMSGQLGSYENRVTQILNNLQTEGQNTQAAYSQIMDVNFASQMATYTLQSTLAQSGEAMLAQANLVPQGLLTLLR
ncbi:MAG: flagellin N-terminal helical domain-containing protein [bacterium]